MSAPNPSGLCWCGCGQTTKRAKRHQTKLGMKKHDFFRYCAGHAESKARAARSDAYAVYMPGRLDSLCLVWQGAVNSKGYPSRQSPETGKTEQVHVAALERRLGRKLKPGHQAHHECVNRRCINGEHLAEHTPLEHAHAHYRMRKVAA